MALTEGQILESNRARYQAFQNLIMYEGQLIWARYNTLLTANTIVAVVLGALATKMSFGLYEKLALVATAVFGLLLTWQWKRITQIGWELQHHWFDDAIKIDCWQGQTDPFRSYNAWDGRIGRSKKVSEDRMATAALWVIYLFMAGYAAAFAVGIGMLVRLRF